MRHKRTVTQRASQLRPRETSRHAETLGSYQISEAFVSRETYVLPPLITVLCVSRSRSVLFAVSYFSCIYIYVISVIAVRTNRCTSRSKTPPTHTIITHCVTHGINIYSYMTGNNNYHDKLFVHYAHTYIQLFLFCNIDIHNIFIA